MKPSNKKMDLLTNGFETQQYQDELMLRLQTVSDDIQTTPKINWQPGFEEIYTHLSDDVNDFSDIPTIPVKH